MTAHPVRATPFTVAGVLSATWAIYKDIFAIVCLPFAFIGLCVGGVSVSVDPDAAQLIDVLLSLVLLPLGATATLIARDVVDGKKDSQISFFAAFGKSYRMFGTLFFLSFLYGLRVLALTLCLVVPGIIELIACSLSAPMVVLDGTDPSTALYKSKLWMKGHRLTLGLAGLVLLLLTVALPLLEAFGAESFFRSETSTAARLFRLALSPAVELGFELPFTLVAYVVYEKVKAAKSAVN